MFRSDLWIWGLQEWPPSHLVWFSAGLVLEYCVLLGAPPLVLFAVEIYRDWDDPYLLSQACCNHLSGSLPPVAVPFPCSVTRRSCSCSLGPSDHPPCPPSVTASGVTLVSQLVQRAWSGNLRQSSPQGPLWEFALGFFVGSSW